MDPTRATRRALRTGDALKRVQRFFIRFRFAAIFREARTCFAT